MINIFNYLDYRNFLKDIYIAKKQLNKKFSFGYISQKLSLERSNTIKIFNCERHLPLDRVDLVTKLFDLNLEESIYLEKSICYTKATTEKERQTLFVELQQLKPVQQKFLEKNQFQLFSSWYHLVILSIIGIKKFHSSTDFSQFLYPQITPSQAQQALDDLLSMGLVQIDLDGFLFKADQNITINKNDSNQLIRQYIQSSLQISHHAFEELPKEVLDFSSLLLECPLDKLPELKEMITDFRKNIIRKVNSFDKSDAVFQLSIQIFPLTQGLDSP